MDKKEQKEINENLFRVSVTIDKRSKLYRAYLLGKKDLAMEMSKILDKITEKFLKG